MSDRMPDHEYEVRSRDGAVVAQCTTIYDVVDRVNDAGARGVDCELWNVETGRRVHPPRGAEWPGADAIEGEETG